MNFQALIRQEDISTAGSAVRFLGLLVLLLISLHPIPSAAKEHGTTIFQRCDV